MMMCEYPDPGSHPGVNHLQVNQGSDRSQTCPVHLRADPVSMSSPVSSKASSHRDPSPDYLRAATRVYTTRVAAHPPRLPQLINPPTPLMTMCEYPACRVVATPLQYDIDLASVPESPKKAQQHATCQWACHQSPAPPSGPWKRKRLSHTVDIVALAEENIGLAIDHIIMKSPSPTAHGAGGFAPSVVVIHRSKTTAPAKKRKSPSPSLPSPPPSQLRPRLRRRTNPEPPQHRHTAKAKAGAAGSKKAAAAKATKAVKAIKAVDVKAETPAQKKKRKTEANRRAAQKYRLKRKAKEGVRMIKVRELEAINARFVAELALIRQLL